MKRFLTLALLVVILGGCAIVPLGYPVHGHANPGYGYDDGYRWHGHGDGPHWRYGSYQR